MTIKTATLLNIDCMAYMATLPDKAFDLAIVDPPYNANFAALDYATGRNEKNATKRLAGYSTAKVSSAMNNVPSEHYFTELKRVSKNQIIWGANHYMQNIALGSPCWVVWDKLTGENGFADCELAYTSFQTAVRKFTFQWSGMLQGDMKNKEQRIHPTQKPVKLYEWLLSNYAKPGDKILDTHGGSMSSVIAAIKMGFDITCCELDKDYFDAAVQRA